MVGGAHKRDTSAWSGWGAEDRDGFTEGMTTSEFLRGNMKQVNEIIVASKNRKQPVHRHRAQRECGVFGKGTQFSRAGLNVKEKKLLAKRALCVILGLSSVSDQGLRKCLTQGINTIWIVFYKYQTVGEWIEVWEDSENANRKISLRQMKKYRREVPRACTKVTAMKMMRQNPDKSQE